MPQRHSSVSLLKLSAIIRCMPERGQSLGAMVGVMRYCMQERKTADPDHGQRYVSGVNCMGLTSVSEFLATKAVYRKTDGVNFYQYVQSFAPGENLTAAEAHSIALEFAARAWPGYEVLVCTHCDAAHMNRYWNGSRRVEYVCRTYHRGGKEQCGSHRIREEVIDARVIAYAQALRETWLAEQAALRQTERLWRKKQPDLEKQIRLLKEKIQAWENEAEGLLMEKIRSRQDPQGEPAR